MTKTLNNPYGISNITPSHWPSRILIYNKKFDFEKSVMIKMLPKIIKNIVMDILNSNLLSESISDWTYANWRNWRIFSLTSSQSPKLIPKADLKWEWNSHCILKSCMANGRGVILEMPYGFLRVFSPFLPKKSCQVVLIFRFELRPLNLYPSHVILGLCLILDVNKKN